MSNFKLEPLTGADRERMLGWFQKHNHPVENPRDDSGHIVMGYQKNDFRATDAMYALKRLALFSDKSE